MEDCCRTPDFADMTRVHRIQAHPLFIDTLRLLNEAEQDRIYCKHGIDHLLDVARLMYIYNLEEGTGIRKDVIYATALLHDLGRYEQLTVGTPHDEAGFQLAGEILPDCDFTTCEMRQIQQAILHHRNHPSGQTKELLDQQEPLGAYLYRADKKSRRCYACAAEPTCNWSEEKKNWVINE